MHKASISSVIDTLGVTKYTFTVYFLVGFTLLFDGFDYLIVAYTMPQLAREWGLTKIQTGSLASWSLIGLMIGGLIAGVISDRIGRKKTLALFVAVYSLLTLPIYFVHSFEVFAFLRILSGIGLGACIPIAVTMMAESAPTNNRGFFTSSIMAFYLIGWVIAGLVAIYVVPIYGWRVCYLVGGIPALYVLVLLAKLNESPYWLLGKGREDEAIKIIKKMEIIATGEAGEWSPGSLIAPSPAKKRGISAIFSLEYRKSTVALWMMYFMGSVVIYGISSWLPTLLVEQGYGLVKRLFFRGFTKHFWDCRRSVYWICSRYHWAQKERYFRLVVYHGRYSLTWLCFKPMAGSILWCVSWYCHELGVEWGTATHCRSVPYRI